MLAFFCCRLKAQSAVQWARGRMDWWSVGPTQLTRACSVAKTTSPFKNVGGGDRARGICLEGACRRQSWGGSSTEGVLFVECRVRESWGQHVDGMYILYLYIPWTAGRLLHKLFEDEENGRWGRQFMQAVTGEATEGNRRTIFTYRDEVE
jgi:hypothetical protein